MHRANTHRSLFTLYAPLSPMPEKRTIVLSCPEVAPSRNLSALQPLPQPRSVSSSATASAGSGEAAIRASSTFEPNEPTNRHEQIPNLHHNLSALWPASSGRVGLLRAVLLELPLPHLDEPLRELR